VAKEEVEKFIEEGMEWDDLGETLSKNSKDSKKEEETGG
jgi:hypothetical protein